MKTRVTPCAITALVAAAAFTSTAPAEVIYSQNFENRGITLLPEWSTNQFYADKPEFSRFLGRYHNHTVSLNVPLPAAYVQQQSTLGPRDSSVPTDPPLPPDVPTQPDPNPDIPPTPEPNPQPNPNPTPQTRLQLMLAFDLYVLDSWDGAEQTHGIDQFGVTVNGQQIFLESFANVHRLQSYQGTPVVDRQHLGFNSAYVDSIYRLSIPFDVSGADIARFQFAGSGLLGAMNDESWGIDNVTVSMELVTVPAPGAAGVLAMGALAGLRRRRRA